MIIWDAQVLELVGSKIWAYAVYCKLKPFKDNFLWGLIGVYGPNDDNLRYVLLDKLTLCMS